MDALGTTLVLSSWSGRLVVSRAFAAIIIGWAVVAVAMSRVGTVYEAVAVMLAGGIIYGPWAGLYATVLQRAVPPGLHGRVAGAQSSMTVLGMPLGAFVTGMVLPHVGDRMLFALAGGATLLVGVWAFTSPSLRRFDQRSWSSEAM